MTQQAKNRELVLDRDGWYGMARTFMRAFPDGRHVLDLADAVRQP
jgi:hypothetical protein